MTSLIIMSEEWKKGQERNQFLIQLANSDVFFRIYYNWSPTKQLWQTIYCRSVRCFYAWWRKRSRKSWQNSIQSIFHCKSSARCIWQKEVDIKVHGSSFTSFFNGRDLQMQPDMNKTLGIVNGNNSTLFSNRRTQQHEGKIMHYFEKLDDKTSNKIHEN